jgi:hypothetical protein
MIVLDDQLLRFELEIRISEWYPGAVRFITDLRLDTVIKDDGIPALLRSQKQATFVTINESDFWRKIPWDRHFLLFVLLFLPRVPMKSATCCAHYFGDTNSPQNRNGWVT